jgi:fumarylacetoacetate (FAA) hydrolase family protein
VTFVDSLLERAIEEQCRRRAADTRRDIASQIGNDLRRVRPGTEEAAALKRVLQAKGLWSQTR